MAPERNRGAVAPSSGNVSPPSWKNYVSIGEFSTENCVRMHRKIPSIMLVSTPDEEPSPTVGQILGPALRRMLIHRRIRLRDHGDEGGSYPIAPIKPVEGGI